MIHAARQSGKTTLLLNMEASLEREGRFHALYCSLEVLQGMPDPATGIPGVVERLRMAVARQPEIARSVADASISA